MSDTDETTIDFASAAIVISVVMTSSIPARYFLDTPRARQQSIIRVEKTPFLHTSNVPNSHFASESHDGHYWQLVEDPQQVTSSCAGNRILLVVSSDGPIHSSPIPERQGNSLICHYVGKRHPKPLDKNTLIFHPSSAIPVLYLWKHDAMGYHQYILNRDGDTVEVSSTELYEAVPIYGEPV